MQLSIVVPCFNEAQGLGELYRRVAAAATGVVGASFELVLVNDGSRDHTWASMCALAAAHPDVVAVDLSRNHGHQLALSAGLSVARGSRVLVLDADLQDPPELLPQMMRAMDGGADVVYGQRRRRAGEAWFKRASAALFYRVLDRLTDVQIPVDTGDFRLMSRRTVDLLNSMPESHRFIRGMVSWLGFTQVPIPYDRDARYAGGTGYTFRKMLHLALDAITGFSTRPLRIASLLGLVFAGLGLVGVALSIVGWLWGHTVPGWTSVMVVVLVMGGIQLTVLGIVGEYLGRLYVEAKRRPLFVIQELRTAAGAEIPPSSGSRSGHRE
jgi:polyisoprenyl-phosphate glycosyltransferase